jgi:hypothetical protein
MTEPRYVIWWWWSSEGRAVVEPDAGSVRVFGVADTDAGYVVFGPVQRAAVMRCRLWSLIHGHGWGLPVISEPA